MKGGNDMVALPLSYEPSSIFATKRITVRPGVHLSVSSGTLDDALERQTAVTAPMFELSYSRKGAIAGEVNRKLVTLDPGHSALGFFRSASGHSEYRAGDAVHLYSIWVEPDAFAHFCGAVSGGSDWTLHSFQRGNYHHCSFKSDARESHILGRLDACMRGEGRLNLLLLESRVLELLSLNLEHLLGIQSMGDKLSRTDMERLMTAREILLSRLENPPSILELSRLIQMNDCKLKRAFKARFGQTVYSFVREQRLERAFSLLVSGGCNVSESAFAVGYTNVSHFSEAFRARFGVNPGRIARGGSLSD
jgi:AraC-like DNA-binding protein